MKQPTVKQLEARKKFSEASKARAKARQTQKTGVQSDLNTKDEYLLTVKCNDQTFTCKTQNLAEAIGALNIARFKTRTFITVKKGDKTFTRILNVPRAKKVLKNATATRFFAIGVDKFFKF